MATDVKAVCFQVRETAEGCVFMEHVAKADMIDGSCGSLLHAYATGSICEPSIKDTHPILRGMQICDMLFWCCRRSPNPAAHAAEGQLPGRAVPAGQVAASCERGSYLVGGHLNGAPPFLVCKVLSGRAAANQRTLARTTPAA